MMRQATPAHFTVRVMGGQLVNRRMSLAIDARSSTAAASPVFDARRE